MGHNLRPDPRGVVLLDAQDKPIGTMGKHAAHMRGLYHAAISIILVDRAGRQLLQQRAFTKYHCGGLWTNACCSHPRPDETPEQAAQRRLFEELGFVTEVTPAFDFIYKAALDNDLTEYEFDHVLLGNYDGKVEINLSEVGDFCYRSMEDIRNELVAHPGKYTAWFLIAFPMVEAYLKNKNAE